MAAHTGPVLHFRTHVHEMILGNRVGGQAPIQFPRDMAAVTLCVLGVGQHDEEIKIGAGPGVTPAMRAEKEYFVRMHLVHNGVCHGCNERLIHLASGFSVVSVCPKD